MNPSLTGSVTAPRRDGLFARIGRAIIANQEARARAVVRPYLAQMPDKDLAALGYTKSEINEIRKSRHLPVVSWV